MTTAFQTVEATAGAALVLASLSRVQAASAST